MSDGKKYGQGPPENRLLLICGLLNKAKAKYLVIGGFACALHGLLRATKDIDLLIPKDVKNTEALLNALSELPLRIAGELDAKEVSSKPFTIIGDVPRVDLLTSAGKITFEKAIKTAKATRVSRVKIPFVDLESLLRSKDTGRTQDLADTEALRAMHARPKTKRNLSRVSQ